MALRNGVWLASRQTASIIRAGTDAVLDAPIMMVYMATHLQAENLGF
jgi:hypothetical protein